MIAIEIITETINGLTWSVEAEAPDYTQQVAYVMLF